MGDSDSNSSHRSDRSILAKQSWIDMCNDERKESKAERNRLRRVAQAAEMAERQKLLDIEAARKQAEKAAKVQAKHEQRRKNKAEKAELMAREAEEARLKHEQEKKENNNQFRRTRKIKGREYQNKSRNDLCPHKQIIKRPWPANEQ